MFSIGEILDGRVTGLTKFGAFVSLPDNKTGMVHISEVASSFVNDIGDYLKEGQEVRVMIIDITDDGKIALSVKRAADGGVKPKSEKKKEAAPVNTWKGTPEREQPQTFEDMMAQFKQRSDEKLADLKRATDSRRSSYSRRK
ncbi:MAG: S1 RNA-binding domain-containing protein [Ruminococcaceae bacterium]|nr:S1 RNA-binding domain-containing protein [Oscillospiraceae bacterium]